MGYVPEEAACLGHYRPASPGGSYRFMCLRVLGFRVTLNPKRKDYWAISYDCCSTLLRLWRSCCGLAQKDIEVRRANGNYYIVYWAYNGKNWKLLQVLGRTVLGLGLYGESKEWKMTWKP